MAVGLITQIPTEKPTIDEIIAACVKVTSVSEELLYQHCRKNRIVLCRQLAWKIIKNNYPLMSLNDLARVFGDFDHTTVIHSVNTINNRIKYEDWVRKIHVDVMRLIERNFKPTK